MTDLGLLQLGLSQKPGASLGAFGRIGERAMVGYIDTAGSKLDKAAGAAAFGAKHSVGEGVGSGVLH